VLRARYPCELTVDRADDGTLTLTVTLPFERYLEGIAEVPSSWPRAALEAQAIAARTYALATTGWTGQGRTLDSAICSTTSCQVYRGIPVPGQEGIGRWYAAVRRTAGQMLIYGGRPAQTLYFSTSNGRTHGNEEVFGSAPLPYLRPIVERDDHASPTSHWRVTLPFEDLSTILVAAELWPAGTEVRRAAVLGSEVRVTGAGTERTIGTAEFRNVVNTWAPCVLPARYPPAGRSGAPLPVTVPSLWLTASTGADALVLDGRGWGHGVGMVQWGAYGKAIRGLSAAQILAAYYGGVRPQRFPEPRVIDVEVASGLTSLRVVPSGKGARIDGESLGRGPIVIRGGDRLLVTGG
jgi:stage II sporulation protein D